MKGLKVYAAFSEAGVKPLDMFVLSVIYSFEEEGLPCTATNEWIANQIREPEGTIARSISRLEEKELITVSEEGRLRVICLNKDKFNWDATWSEE